MIHKGAGFDADQWQGISRIYRRAMGLALGRKPGRADAGPAGYISKNEAEMLRTRGRYFTDGAVIGSRGFVNDAFAAARDRFTERRKDGARRMRGSGKAAAGVLWSMRDLRVGI